MLHIKVEHNNIEKALKEYKRKVSKVKQIQNLRERQEFVKPSVKNRSKVIKAKHIQKLRDQEDF
jgi:small subunit ribosomal protein S21